MSEENVNLHYNVKGGGLWSLIQHVAIQNLKDVNFDKIYLEAIPVEDVKYPKGMLNAVLEQDNTLIYKNMGTLQPSGDLILHDRDKDKIEESLSFMKYKKVIERLKFHTVTTVPILSDTLGVHIRLTTMNLYYPGLTLDHYRRQIDLIKPNRIFLASDNHEAIDKLKSEYSNVSYHHNFLRYDKCELTSDFWNIETACQNNPAFHQQSYKDCLALSQCDSLLVRVSSLANMSILLSKNKQKIYNLL